MRPPAAPAAAVPDLGAVATESTDPVGDLARALAAADPARGPSPAAALWAAQTAAALAEQLQQAEPLARAQAWRAIHWHALGRFAELLADWRAVEARLAQARLLHEHAEFLRVVTLAGSETAAHDQALDAAQRQVEMARDQDAPGLLLQAKQSLAICFERMGDSWQALRLLRDAMVEDGDASPALLRLRGYNGIAAVGIGLCHRLRGVDDAEADALLDQAFRAASRAHALLDEQPGLAARVAVCGNLGESLMLRGATERAVPFVEEALNLARDEGLQGYEGRLRVTWAALQWAQGQAQAAAATLQSLLADASQLVLPETQIRGHRLAYQLAKAEGRLAEALTHFEQAEALERRRTLVQLKAQSALFVTRSETERVRLQAEQAQAEAQQAHDQAAVLARTAETDPLTGLGNRRHLQRRWAELGREPAEQTPRLALALLDLDHFKRVNDEHGHDQGDRVLVQLAGLLREATRQSDVLVRHGGEEFLVLMPGLSAAQAQGVCERVREAVASARWMAGATPLNVTVSIGLAMGQPQPDLNLVRRADEALYRAKRAGRNRVIAADEPVVGDNPA